MFSLILLDDGISSKPKRVECRKKICEYQFVGEIIKAVKTLVLTSTESECVFIIKGLKENTLMQFLNPSLLLLNLKSFSS